MGFLFGDANFGQVVNNRLSFDFELAGQFVNTNLSFFCHPARLRSLLVARFRRFFGGSLFFR
jgi:hypothetical protein